MCAPPDWLGRVLRVACTLLCVSREGPVLRQGTGRADV
jgi:hypothetical protein